MLNKFIKKLFPKKIEPIDFSASMGLADLPVVTFYQGDKKFNFLLDTGSNSNIIDSNILGQITHTKSDEQMSLYGLEGREMIVGACTITLSYKSNSYTYDYLVRDMSLAFGGIKKDTGVTIHGILGSKFFNKFKYVLDFAELIAYSKK